MRSSFYPVPDKALEPVSFDAGRSPWYNVFGDRKYTSESLDPEAMKLTVAPDLPAAMMGKSIFNAADMRVMVGSTDNWPTRIALPLTFTDRLDWTTNKTTFDVRLPRNTPYKAPSRVLNSRTTTEGGKLQRHGIAIELEMDFAKTAEGRQHYALQLNQAANSVIHLLNIGVIKAYLEADGYAREWEKNHGIRAATDVYARIEREVKMFAIVQKEKHGLKKLDAIVTETMSAYEATADMWIVPPMLKMYDSLVPNENVDYMLAGARAAVNLENSTVVRYTINGVPTYISHMSDEIARYGHRNLLSSTVEIGSYNTMVDVNKDASDTYWESQYASAHRAIEVYDEDVDENIRLTLDTALDNCYVFENEDGHPKLPKEQRIYSADPSDQNDDMLSYLDDDEDYGGGGGGGSGGGGGTGKRKPVKLFGHISKEHFSPHSIINLCATVAKYHTKGTTSTVRDMEGIIKAGLALVKKMNTVPITSEWIFNVYYEYVMSSGVGNSVSEPLEIKEAENEIFAKMTKVAKRSPTKIRVFKGFNGEGPGLPKFNYFEIAQEKRKQGGSEKRNEGEKDKEAEDAVLENPYFLTQEVIERYSKDIKYSGGSCSGALAGFATYDGLMALARELDAGGSLVSGYTKHGYSLEDCQTAAAYLNLIKDLVATGRFLFDNDVYLDANNVSDLVDDPTVEHAFAENLAGLNKGFPAFLNLNTWKFAISNAEVRSKDSEKEMASKQIDRFDAQNTRSLLDVITWLEQQFGEGAKSLLTLIKKLLIRTTYNARIERKFVRLYTSQIIPFASVDVEASTNVQLFWRYAVIDTLSLFSKQKTMSTEDKIRHMTIFLEPLHQMYPYHPQATRSKPVELPDDFGVPDGLPDSRPVEEMDFETVFRSFSHKKNMNFIKQKRELYFKAQEKDMQGEKPFATSTAAADFFVGERYGQTEDRDNQESLRIAQDAKEIFFRSPLCLSAKQVVGLSEIMQFPKKLEPFGGWLRVGDPNDSEKYVEPRHMRSLIDKIESINQNASRNFLKTGKRNEIAFTEAYESPIYFYPEHIALKERALVLSGLGGRSSSDFFGVTKDNLRKRKMRNGGHDKKHDHKRQKTSLSMGSGIRYKKRLLNSTYDDEDENGDESFSSFDTREDFGTAASALESVKRQLVGEHLTKQSMITSNILDIILALDEHTASPLYKMLAKIYLTSALNHRTLKKFIKHNILFPFGFLVFRPHMRYESNCAIKTKAGESTGVTYVGNMGLGGQPDYSTKTILVYFTIHDDSVIRSREQVYVAHNVFISKCLGGAGFVPMEPAHYNTRTGQTNGGSAIFVMIPYEETKFNPYMDVTGRFSDATGIEGKTYVDRAVLMNTHYSQCWRANQVWRFRGADQVGADELDIGRDYEDERACKNTVVIQAQQKNFNMATRDWTTLVINKGHWGPEGPGSREGRNGGLRALVEHQKISLV